jgi:frataxin-like iron-binding protein CyaY
MKNNFININKFSKHAIHYFTRYHFAIYKDKPNYSQNSTERLNNKTRNLGVNTGQIQNYEKHILNRAKEEREVNIEKDIESMFDAIESTNSTLLVNINNSEQSNLKFNDLPFNEYLIQAEKYFNLLKSAFANLIEVDENISIETDGTRYNLFLKINVKKVGVYTILKELEGKIISVTSPISGLFKYKFDTVSNYWISTKDKHILEELLIREFCLHSKGLLIINNN